MNKTKKITTGAMLLAIVGALMLIDRQLTNIFEYFVILAFPIIIIIYSAIYTVKDGALLSFGLAVLTLLFGTISTYVYLPISIVTGIGYSLALKKNASNGTLVSIAIILYVIGEVLVAFLVMPLMGISIKEQIAASQVLSDEILGQAGLESVIGSIKHFDELLVVIFIVSIIIMGLLEGVLIHFFSIFIIKRFKIINLNERKVIDMKANPYLAYPCMLSIILAIIFYKLDIPILIYIFVSLAMISAMILMYYGYLFIVIYGAIVFRRNVGIFIFIGILFASIYVLIALIIIGFLYSAGPLYNYLERIKKGLNETNQQG